jgi:hypothetical protein
VYVTLLGAGLEENGDQVRAFLARQTGFALVPPGEAANALGEARLSLPPCRLMSDGGLL